MPEYFASFGTSLSEVTEHRPTLGAGIGFVKIGRVNNADYRRSVVNGGSQRNTDADWFVSRHRTAITALATALLAARRSGAVGIAKLLT
jgi:hypothetical protein